MVVPNDDVVMELGRWIEPKSEFLLSPDAYASIGIYVGLKCPIFMALGWGGALGVSALASSCSKCCLRPEEGVVKVNIDAAVDSRKKISGLGWIGRDSSGISLFGGMRKFQKDINVDLGEALAIKFAMLMVCELHVDNVIFESDSKTIIECINGKGLCSGGVQLIIDDILSPILFCNRQANNVAHRLACWARDDKPICMWEGDPPTWILSTISADLDVA